jgi:hypothetical protein
MNKKSNLYHVNCEDIGYKDNGVFLFIGGGMEGAVWNMSEPSKAKCIKDKDSTGFQSFTAAKFSSDYSYIIYATGYDWMEGVNGLENAKRPKIYAYKFSTEEMKTMTKEKSSYR